MKFFDDFIDKRSQILTQFAFWWDKQSWRNKVLCGVGFTLGSGVITGIIGIGVSAFVPWLVVGLMFGALVSTFVTGVLESLNGEVKELRENTADLQSKLVRSEREVRSQHINSIKPVIDKMHESAKTAKEFCDDIAKESENINEVCEVSSNVEHHTVVLSKAKTHLQSIDELIAKHKKHDESPNIIKLRA